MSKFKFHAWLTVPVYCYYILLQCCMWSCPSSMAMQQLTFEISLIFKSLSHSGLGYSFMLAADVNARPSLQIENFNKIWGPNARAPVWHLLWTLLACNWRKLLLTAGLYFKIARGFCRWASLHARGAIRALWTMSFEPTDISAENDLLHFYDGCLS